MTDARILAQETLLSLLLPVWQATVGACVLLALILSVRVFVRRGRSRMTTALLLTGGAVIGLVAIGILLQSL